MNILYCGDINIIDGLIISILSILKNTDRALSIYVLTMEYKGYQSMPPEYIELLNKVIKKKNKKNTIKLIDITDIVKKNPVTANQNTRFTPFCMLRVYIDLIDDIPKKILYLDNDTVVLKNIDELYDKDITNCEIAGVLDYYGSKFFRKKLYIKDYINSGVLLMNKDRLIQNNSLEKVRKMVRFKKMLMPDQSALNKVVKHKLIIERKFNEQKEIREDTVIRHFTTTFKFYPYFKLQTIKPWDIEGLHNTLKTHDFDDILDNYKIIKEEVKECK